MFDGITHNHNTNGGVGVGVGRMRKDFPGDHPEHSPMQMGAPGGEMCDGTGIQYQQPQQQPQSAVPPEMGLLPGVGMMGMEHYGNAFQLSANVQAEAEMMNEEERRRRFGDGRMPQMGEFDMSAAKMAPFRQPLTGEGCKSSAEEDEEDEDDYDEEFEDTRTMEERQAGKPIPKRRKIQFNCFQCPKR